MIKKIFLSLTSVLITYSICLAQIDTSTEPIQNEVSDSLMQYLEERAVTEYGINSNYTLAQTARALNLELTALKRHLNLEYNDTKLDNMRLRQLGISIYSVLLAQETIQYGFNGTSTLKQISDLYSIPVKKLKAMLNLDTNDRSLNERSLASLSIPLDEVVRMREEFNENLLMTGGSILVAGMTVVFFALLLTCIIISQLKRLNTREKMLKPLMNISKRGNVLSNAEIISNDEVAAIAAVRIYMSQLEERRRIALTFQRARTNYWHAAGISDMPNKNLHAKRNSFKRG